MAEEKSVRVGPDKEVLIKPALAERPALGPAVAEVRITAPWWPGRERRNVIRFLDALATAFRIRARDEADINVVGEGNRVVVRRRLPGGGDEVRFEREGKRHAVLFCDRRELENLYALGLLTKAQVAWPGRNAKTPYNR